MSNQTPSPIRLTTANFWVELEKLRLTMEMPARLVDCLKSLVSNHLHSMITPEATTDLIWLAKKYLTDGIMLSDSASDLLYDVMVYVPNPDQSDKLRSFFRLIPKWPDGQLKYLSQIEN